MSQSAVQKWFDATYASKALGYLRPPEFYAMLIRQLDIKAGQKLLDIGCGPGLLLAQAAERGLECYGVDLSRVALRMVGGLAPGARVAACNAEALCFHDKSFDHITCIGVFEHFLHPERALTEMKRVAKDHARVCILVPNSRSLRRMLHMPRTASGRSEESVATLEEWSRIFTRSGFVVEHIRRDQWFNYRLQRFFPERWEGSARQVSPRHILPLKYASQFVFLLRL
jgi:ubiquinone/menaquinone biosynthesis C-methylase UbiE